MRGQEEEKEKGTYRQMCKSLYFLEPARRFELRTC